MKNRTFVTILIVTALLGLHKISTFAFDVPKMNLPISLPANPLTSNNSSYKLQIGAVNSSVDQASTFMNNSVFALSEILLSKEKVQELKLTKDDILSKTKDKEKQATLNKISTDYMAALQAEIEKNTINTKVSQLNSKQKELYANAVYNVGLAGLNYTDASIQATQLVQTISANPTAAAGLVFEVKQLNKLVTSLPQQAKTTATLTNNLVKIGTANKIMVKLPTSKADLPKSVDINLK